MIRAAPSGVRLALAALLLGACACAQLARAEAPKTVFLEDLTWTELRDQVQAGKTTVILPVGGTEQSGPALTLGKHNARASALAARIATALGNALVAPVDAYVPEGTVEPPSAHMKFPGTITLPAAAFETTLEYAARSLRRAGFRDIVLIGDHGGYQESLRRSAARLNREWAASPVRVHALTEYYRAADADYAKALQARGFSAAEIGTHAGLADTALSLALAPHTVRPGQLPAAARGGAALGVHGDPSRASAEIGQIGVDLIVARSVEAIRRDIARR
jgi:creatinine amidohydrolase/Fe(II)-dependent formamide hydrolase-like protein